MITKKENYKLSRYALDCFKKLLKDGGHYFEKDDKEIKLIYFKYPNKITIQIPMTQIEYREWRKIKPQLQKLKKLDVGAEESK